MLRVTLLTMALSWPLGGLFFYSLAKAASRADEAAELAHAMHRDITDSTSS